jgi:hypothetical protein
MSSPLGGKRNVKIFILYLMQNIRFPVDFATLNDMVMQTDYVVYLDLAECFYEVLADGLIREVEEADEQDGEDNKKKPPRYEVTEKGKMVAEQLHSELLPTILEESLRCALRYLDFRKRGIRLRCRCTPNGDGTVEFYCAVEQLEKPTFEMRVNVDSMVRARQMEDNFRAHPENIYKGMWALLCGNMNYLFS